MLEINDNMFVSRKLLDNRYDRDSDHRLVSNLRPLLKSASTDVIISNHGPI
jgi:hypothetical protein